jgi:hypothetical protein
MHSTQCLHWTRTTALAFLTGAALFGSLRWWLLAVAFFGNFDLGSLWHLFVLVYTFALPPLAILGYVIAGAIPGKRSTLLSLVLSVATLATYFLWTSERSSGLTH